VVGPAGYPLTPPVGYGNPVNFGATGNGTSDDTAAFQAAINAGNVYVSTVHTYNIGGQIIIPSNRTLQCAPGVVLRTLVHSTNDPSMLRLNGATGVSILGCTLIGANSTTPPILDNNQGTCLISLWGSSTNLIAANTCKWSFGNACVHISDRFDGAGAASTFNVIRNNDFGPTGYYGVAIIVGTDNQVLWNNAVDAAIGSEANAAQATGTNSRNTFGHNVVTKVNTNGWDSVSLTGGSAIAGFDYSTNVVSNNTVQGSGSRINQNNGGGAIPAQYINNFCINGCGVF
jgi:hypothetical protein